MLLDSRFKSVQQALCCLTVGLLGFGAASIAQNVAGQQVQVQQIQPAQTSQFRVPQVRGQQSTVIPPTRIYQSPIYQSPIIHGPIYQSPSYYQGQTPIVGQQVGPVYRALQGTIQTVPPVAKRLSQAVQPSQRQLDQAAAQAALDAEKIAVLEKLLQKYKDIAANGQRLPVELDALKRKNAELVKEVESLSTQKERIAELTGLVERMRTQYSQSEAKVQELEKQLGAVGQKPGAMEDVEKLEAQVASLEAKLQALSGENKSYVGQLADAKAAIKAAMESQPDENEKAELIRKSQALVAENLELVQATSFVQPAVDVSSFESKIAQLTRKNRQLADSNAGYKGENQSLARQLSSLESQSNETANSEDSTSLISTSESAASVSALQPNSVEGKGGWGILGWLIPFLAIGLGVAFFVILKEEFQRPAADKLHQPKD